MKWRHLLSVYAVGLMVNGTIDVLLYAMNSSFAVPAGIFGLFTLSSGVLMLISQRNDLEKGVNVKNE